MASDDAEARFSINLGGDAAEVADGTAESIETLRLRIEGAQGSLRAMQGALTSLRGSSDAVKTAKDELRAKIEAERAALSSANLKMLQAGTTYGKVAGEAKKLAKEQDELAKKAKAKGVDDARAHTSALGAVARAVGGPVASLKDKLGSLSEIASGAGNAMGAVRIAALGTVAAVVALAVGLGIAAFAFARFVFESANAARSQNLLREAATGSALNAKNLGTQVDALAKKVPLGKAALNDLAVSLAKAGLSGQTLVDTLNALGQASAALGDDAAAKLREFVERGRLTQRFALNPLELVGTGVSFDEISKALARSLGVGIKEARAALVEGRVKLEDGAKALRDAVEAKFAQINLRKLASLEGLTEKVGESFRDLASGVDLEPVLLDVRDLFDLASEKSATGRALKDLVTTLGKGLVSALHGSAPIAKAFFQNLVLSALKLEIEYFRLKVSAKKALGDTSLLRAVSLTRLVMGQATVASALFRVSLEGAAIGAKLAAQSILGLAVVVNTLLHPQPVLLEWRRMGEELVDGLTSGIASRLAQAKKQVIGLATTVKDTFAGALKIGSPSKVFEDYGRDTSEGYERGLDGGADDVTRTTRAMAPLPPQNRANASAPLTATFHFHVDSEKTARAMREGSFLADLTKAVEQALRSAGVPVPG